MSCLRERLCERRCRHPNSLGLHGVLWVSRPCSNPKPGSHERDVQNTCVMLSALKKTCIYVHEMVGALRRGAGHCFK